MAPRVEFDRDPLLVQRVHDTPRDVHASIRTLPRHCSLPIMRRLGCLGIPLAVEKDKVGNDDDLVGSVVFLESGDDGGNGVGDDGVHGLDGLVDCAKLIVEVVEVDGLGHGGRFEGEIVVLLRCSEDR